jgi:hypothetical protein
MKMKRLKWAKHSIHGEMSNLYRNLAEKPERKWPLGRSRKKWRKTKKMILIEGVCKNVDWIHVA